MLLTGCFLVRGLQFCGYSFLLYYFQLYVHAFFGGQMRGYLQGLAVVSRTRDSGITCLLSRLRLWNQFRESGSCFLTWNGESEI